MVDILLALGCENTYTQPEEVVLERVAHEYGLIEMLINSIDMLVENRR